MCKCLGKRSVATVLIGRTTAAIITSYWYGYMGYTRYNHTGDMCFFFSFFVGPDVLIAVVPGNVIE